MKTDNGVIGGSATLHYVSKCPNRLDIYFIAKSPARGAQVCLHNVQELQMPQGLKYDVLFENCTFILTFRFFGTLTPTQSMRVDPIHPN